MNITCDVICDLIPLYHDGVCSEGSRALVEEHLKGCDACRRELDITNAQLAAPHIKPENEKFFKAVSSAWKAVKKKAFIKGAVITVVICALLAGGFAGLTQWKCLPVSSDVLEVTELSQLPDGSVVFNLFVNDDKNLYLIKYITTDDGSLYVTPMHSVIEARRKYNVGAFDQYHAFNLSGYTAETPAYTALPMENISRIYAGPVGEGTLIWEAGMTLPAAGEDIEQMFIN